MTSDLTNQETNDTVILSGTMFRHMNGAWQREAIMRKALEEYARKGGGPYYDMDVIAIKALKKCNRIPKGKRSEYQDNA